MLGRHGPTLHPERKFEEYNTSYMPLAHCGTNAEAMFSQDGKAALVEKGFRELQLLVTEER